jgi:hypothetical protein
MSRSGSGNRQRQLTLSARFNAAEAEAIRLRADFAGTSVAALLRSAALNQPVTRATRRPTVNHQQVARLLGELGRIADTLRSEVDAGRLDPTEPNVAAAFRDLAEMRSVCFLALGRAP